MIRLGIECENLEDAKSRWGVGHMVLNLLQEYAKNREWQKEFKLYLYFNKFVPDDEVLKNPIFIKRVLGWKFFKSFNFFYHILMPINALRDRLNFMFFPAYMMPPLYTKKAIVMLTDDVYYEYKFGSLPFRYKLAYRLFTNWAAKFAYKILAISETSRKELIRLYKIDSDKVFVSKLGVSEREYNQNIQAKNYILYVGQMFPRRHAKELVFAFEKIAREFMDIKLILVGRDKYPRPTMNNLIREANNRLHGQRIIYHDYISEEYKMRDLYAGAKLFVYVSDREAFGLPPVEAASFGVPVVVMDNNLNHELFQKSAFLSKSGSAEDIAEALYQGLTNEELYNKMVKQYKTIIPQLSWNNFAKNFFENVKK